MSRYKTTFFSPNIQFKKKDLFNLVQKAEKLMTTQIPVTTTMIMSSSSSSSSSSETSSISDSSSSSDSSSGSMETSTVDSSDSSTIALTSTGTDALPTSANTISFVCPPLVVDVFADPNNCHRFYFCVFGTQLSMVFS